MTLPRVTLLLLLAFSLSVSAAQPPLVNQLVTYPLDYRGRYLTQADADQIVSFIKTVSGVDHRVRLISVTSADDVEVHTGPRLGDATGNTIHLRKCHGTWTIVGKSKGSGS